MFKVGDKVICVEHGGVKYIRNGNEYVISKIENYHPDNVLVRVEEFPNRKFFDWRFVLKAPPPVDEPAVGLIVVDGAVKNAPVEPAVHAKPVLPPENKEEDMNIVRVPALYLKAKEAKVKNRSKMNKAQLIAALQELQAKKAEGAIIKPAAPVAPPPDPFALGKELRKRVKNTPGTCSYVVKEGPDPGDVNWHVADVCHYRLRSSTDIMTECVLDVEGHYINAADKEGYAAFVEYMLLRSPFAETFTTKTFAEARAHGVYMNCNEPMSNIVTAAVALRGASEHNYILPNFKKIKEMGFSEKVAHIACHLFYEVDGKWKVSSLGGWHSVFISTQNMKEIVRTFRDGLWRNKKKPAANKAGARDYRIHSTIAGEGGSSLGMFSVDAFPETTIGMGWNAEKALTQRTLFRGLEKLDELLTKAIEPVVQ